HSGAVERIKEVGVALAAPGPAALAEGLVVRDRAVVDLDHHSASAWHRLEWAQPDDAVEDRVFGGIQRTPLLPVPRQAAEHGQRQQRIDGEAQPLRAPGQRTPVAAFEHGPGVHEADTGPGHRRVDRTAHTVAWTARHTFLPGFALSRRYTFK